MTARSQKLFREDPALFLLAAWSSANLLLVDSGRALLLSVANLPARNGGMALSWSRIGGYFLSSAVIC